MKEDNLTYEQLKNKFNELELELAERNSEKFKFLADNSIDCLWQLDRQLKFIYLSPALYHMTGFKPEEWVGTHLWTHFKRREFIGVGRLAIKMLRQYKTFGFVTFTTKMLNKANEEFPVEIISKPMVDKNGNLIGLQGTTREISERVKNQKELERVNTELKKTNEELNAKLNEIHEINSQLLISRNKAQESDRLKSAFLANMSHEIRTPMNGIIGFTNLLLKPDLNDNTKEKYIKIIHQSGERMLNTVTDIIEISKIEAGIIEVKKTEIDVNVELKNLLNFFQPQTLEKGLILSLKNEVKGLCLHTDLNKFLSILTNLIKNAIKFTDKGEITISYCIKNEFIEFCVKDTGIGIPKYRLSAIFNRFEQADIEDTRVYEGSGLGLAIAKSYVEMLGGNIRVESREGHGSEFCFTIPKFIIKNDKASNYKQEKNEKRFNRQYKILIVEDDETSALFLKTLLNDIAENIIHVNSGEKAIDLCKNQTDFDVILMDIKMPGISGFETTKRIREFNKTVIIIAQTAFALSGDKEKAISCGCNDYIAKPINENEILEIIEKNVSTI